MVKIISNLFQISQSSKVKQKITYRLSPDRSLLFGLEGDLGSLDGGVSEWGLWLSGGSADSLRNLSL